MAMTTILETKRLVLREMTEADAGGLLALNQNPNVTRYILGESPVTELSQALAILRERVFPQYARGLGRWACIEKSNGDFIGWSGIKHLPETGEYDIGYRLFEHHWGKGYATEAANAVCVFARQRLPFERVIGTAMLDNRGSRRVLEKVGLVFERVVGAPGEQLAIYVLPIGARNETAAARVRLPSVPRSRPPLARHASRNQSHLFRVLS